jgi:hypothetical protein
MLRTPGGRPCLGAISPGAANRSGVSDDGFTTVLPQAGRGDLPGGQQQGSEGRDGADDADRLATGVAQTSPGTQRLAGDLGRVTGPVLEAVGRERHIYPAALADRLAIVERLEPGDGCRVAFQQRGNAQQVAAALAGRHARPRSLVECPPRRRDGGIHVISQGCDCAIARFVAGVTASRVAAARPASWPSM